MLAFLPAPRCKIDIISSFSSKCKIRIALGFGIPDSRIKSVVLNMGWAKRELMIFTIY